MPDTVFRGGAEFQRKLAEIARKATSAAKLRVGFLEDSTYPDGTSVPAVAFWQEFGAPRAGIPPRPFFRPMIEEKKREWPQAIAGVLKATGGDAKKALEIAGEAIAGQLRESIIGVTEPPLSPVTLMIRQIVGPNGTPTFDDVKEARRRVAAGETASGVSTKPLIWTSHMLNSIGKEVE